MAFEIKDPPEFTLDVEQWTRETDADGAQMALVIEKLLNNEVFLKRLIEALDGNAVKVGDKGTSGGVASLGEDGKLEQRVEYGKLDNVPSPAWGSITGKPISYPPSWHTHDKSEVGLGNVDNTADANKRVSYAASAGNAETVDGKHAAAFAASSHTHDAATQSVAGLMSANDKKKLDGIAAGANAYSHPTGNGNNHIPSGGSSGQILRWLSAGTATWGSDNNTTYGAATQSAAGLMSANDKKKLDGIAAGANMLKSDIVNNCTSTDTNKPLAAAQGKVLMDKCNQLNSDLHDNLASVVIWKQYIISLGVLKPGANRYDQHTTISLPAGYTSAAIAGFGLDGSGYTSCTITKLQLIDNVVTWSVENRGVADTGNLTLKVDILLFKTK